jgi:outer membrane protein OmpA-like peptidoglycan-associated protein
VSDDGAVGIFYVDPACSRAEILESINYSDGVKMVIGKTVLLATILACTAMVSSGLAQNAASYDELVALRDSALVKEAPIFAPGTWEKADSKFAEAQKAIQLKKNQKSVDKYVAEAREYVENALRTSEVVKNTLREYLPPRDRAREAKAHILVPDLYQKAEWQFTRATQKVEAGDVKGGLSEAGKAVPMLDGAELEAIRADILGPADKLIEKARTDEADKYGLSTLDKAKSARDKANAIITADRYDKDAARVEAARAEYEARHASNIAQSVRSLNRNDEAWEKLMLGYEIQMDRVGAAIGLEHLPFDQGPLAAADTLINYIKGLESEKREVTSQMGSLSDDVAGRLHKTLEQAGVKASDQDPVKLAAEVELTVAELLSERNELRTRLESSESELTSLSEQHDEMTGELNVRVEREEKFARAKMMLNPSEGEVLFNSSNDIVLRLSGLSFDVGKSDIKDAHIPLLDKVEEVVRMFPEGQLMVEGHTDDSGEAAANVDLSERRAYAVMQYLRQSLLIPASRIQSMGFGADRPVASNRTEDGRAKNRRIDIIIMH